MLKTKKSKIIIGAVAILAVLAASSIWVMSNMKSNSVDDFGYRALANADNAAATLTQLDHIIENSIDGEDPVYHVYIITPGAADVSTVSSFFTNNDAGFRKYVVNDNRTITNEMNPDKVDVTVKAVGDLNAMSADEVSTELGKADLIYMYASGSDSYTGGNAIGEDLYGYLHNYAFGLNKPLIMNYGLSNSGDNDDIQPVNPVGKDSATYFMTTQDFKNSWKRTRTTNIKDWVLETAFGSGDGQVQDIIKKYISSNRSTYIRYELNNNTVPDGYTWESYWARTGTPSMLNVLYIYGDSTDASQELQDIEAIAAWMVGDGKHVVFNTMIDGNLPTNSDVTPLRAGTLTVDDLYTDATRTVKKYDYIFIAPDTYANTDLSSEVVAELNQLSEDKSSLTYILFGTLKGASVTTGGGTGTTPENLTIDTSTNYGKLIDLSITTNGYAKKSNILVVGTEYMNTLAGAPKNNPTKVSQVVSLLNKSTFRTYAGSGSGGGSGSVSTTAYRVLELQPCYPIDKELAATKTNISTNLSKYTNATWSGSQYDATKPVGNYYTIPANVLNTSEIDNFMTEDSSGNLSMTQEYYQWDLSKAKLAYALNMSADQIELVQMSTDEYITVKTDVSDSYDLIYIGGNMSAFKNNLAYGFSPMNYSIESWRDYEAVFSMYSHTGELTEITGQRITKNNPYRYTLMNGNDITYDRLTQLEAYIDAGMPIVFSNEIWNAYNEAKTKGYKNRYMDPDCNMYKLCEYAENAATTKPTVLPNWENRQPSGNTDAFFTDYYVAKDEMTIENGDGFYGSAAKVTVYEEYLSQQLYDCVYAETASIRPKYTIDTTALTYVEGDSKTELTNRSVSWKVSLLNPVEGHTYQAMLLEDTDDNGVFDVGTAVNAGERIATASFVGDTAELAYTYPSDEFGAFSWKILVQDTTSGAASGYSAITCFAKLEDQPKKEASILEIMPMTVANCRSDNPTAPDGHTFYLDKNYQQSSGNPYRFSSYGTKAADEYGYCPIMHNSNSYGSDALNFNSNVIAKATSTGNYQGLDDMNMGKYMSSLSINRYDSTAGHEDRDYNYMDLVSDEYDFSLDIMYMDDIEFYANAARTSTPEERETYAEEAELAKELYDAYLTEGTPEYERLKKVEDALREALISIRDGNGYSATYVGTDWQGKEVSMQLSYPSSAYKTYDIDGMLASRDYFRFFYLNNEVYHGSNYCQSAGLVYFGAYKPYIEEHDKMVEAYRKYRHYSMMAYGPNEYLRKNYDVIVVGFLDDYAGNFKDFSQNATDDLLAFTTYKDEKGKEDGGSLMMTHDNMTYSNEASHAQVLTATMRSVMGMAPFQKLTAIDGTGESGINKYKSSDEDRYFLSNLSSDASMDLSKNSSLTGSAWNSTVSSWRQRASKGGNGLGLLGYTDVFNVYETNNGKTLRYSYAEFQIENAIKYNMQVSGPLNVTGTAKATQVNRGVVTTYPFYIASDLRISNTHSQAFALDLEDEDVTVWYTLAADSSSSAGTSGGTDYTTMKENSSFYAASPKDGADSYYIYSVGNITYCGAGHALITGDQRDNNDERRLFLNVLINMAQKTGKTKEKEPGIVLFDPDGKTKAPGNIVKRDAENDYYINVNSGVSYPEFGFGIENLPSGQTVKNVQIFYDLDYTPGMEHGEDFVDNENHVLIPTTDTIINALNSGEVYLVNRTNCPALVTKREYFDKNYGGQYTYIVVRVTLSDDSVMTKRIKIILTRDLLDLT